MSKKPKQRSAAPGANFAPGVQLPPGVTVEKANTFTPDVTQSLNDAKRHGRYFIAVVQQVDDSGGLTINAARSSDFNSDFLLRGWQEVARKIIDGSLSGVSLVAGADTDEKGG